MQVPLNAIKDAVRGVKTRARDDLGHAREQRNDDPVQAVFLAVREARAGNEVDRAAEANALLHELCADDTVVRAVVEATDAADDERREALIEGLRRGGAVAGLAQLLHSTRPEVARAVPTQLARVADLEGAADSLISALTHDDNEVRALAVEALTSVRISRAAPALIRLLDESGSSLGVIAALGKTGTPEAARRLAALVTADSEAVRLTATRALAETRQSEAVAGLIAALADDESSVRQAAADGLGALAADGAADGAIESLVGALADADREVRWRAAKTLGALGAASASARLAEVAADDPDDWVRENAANAIDRMGG